MPGLDLNLFRVAAPGPVERQRPDYSWIDNLGAAIARGRHENTAEDQRQQELDRAEQRDTRADSRERVSQEQRARELLMSDKRAGEREGLYRTQEERRQEQALYERKNLLRQEHEALFRQLQDAKTPWEAEGAAQALEREGYHVRRPDAVPASPAPAATVAAPVAPAPATLAPRAALPGERKHLSKGSADLLSKDLAGQQRRILTSIREPTPGGAPASAPPTQYPVLAPPGSRPLPGENPLVTRSAQFLSPDDPYNDIK